jgi:molybdate transport repressor ModE-like protein
MIRIDIRPVWRFTIEGREKDFDFQLIALLEALHREPKLTAAAAHAGISYRHAWNLIEQWQEFFGAPLVEMERGKGTRLTALGSNLLWAGQRARARLAPDLESLASEFAAALNAAFEGTAPPLVLHASHDYAVAGLREFLSPRGIVAEVQYRGSFESLAALVRGECDLAGFHLPEGPLGGPIAHRYLECLRGSRGAEFHVIALARRTQGFIVRTGNPLRIAGIRDLARPDVRMINRQRGSGTRALLEALLSAEAIDRARLRGYDIEEATHAAVAALIAGGQADVGFGVQAAAAQYRLDFVPVCRERYYFACRAEAIANPRIEGLLGILRDAMYRDLVGRLAGYSAEEMGRMGLATEILARAEAEALG